MSSGYFLKRLETSPANIRYKSTLCIFVHRCILHGSCSEPRLKIALQWISSVATGALKIESLE
jgi:hypothetical protein